MFDQLNFIEGGDARGDAVMAAFARQIAEVVPSIRASGGFAFDPSRPRLSVAVRKLRMDGSRGVDGTAPSALRAAVWEEPPAHPAVLCAHLAVVNTNTSAPALFEFELGGHAPPATALGLTARRIFSLGATVDVSSGGGGGGSSAAVWRAAHDFIAPGQTNLYRIGCGPGLIRIWGVETRFSAPAKE